MAVVYQYGFFLLAGMVIGIIIGVRIDVDTIYKIARIKIKGRGHTVSDVIDVNPKSKKEIRKQRRQDKHNAQ